MHNTILTVLHCIFAIFFKWEFNKRIITFKLSIYCSIPKRTFSCSKRVEMYMWYHVMFTVSQSMICNHLLNNQATIATAWMGLDGMTLTTHTHALTTITYYIMHSYKVVMSLQYMLNSVAKQLNENQWHIPN